MSVKESVYAILEQNRDRYLSGEKIATELSVSRAAVWKAVKSLELDGCRIDAIQNRGYRMQSDSISEAGIRYYLPERYQNLRIDVKKSTVSTNQDAKMLAISGALEGTVVLADEQTGGRGRLGRMFASPAGTGIYLSIILKPHSSFSDAVLITTAAAVAVADAIESVTGLSPEIKWVNDLYLNNKKICGILTEAVSDFESGTIESVIVGVGINVSISSALPEGTGAIYTQLPVGIRNRLASAVIANILTTSENFSSRTYLTSYRRRSLVLGKPIRFFENGIWSDAIAVDIADNGGLVIETEAGRRTLTSGEITLRLQ